MLEAFWSCRRKTKNLVLCFPCPLLVKCFIFVTDPSVEHTVPKSYKLIQELEYFNICWRISFICWRVGRRRWSSFWKGHCHRIIGGILGCVSLGRRGRWCQKNSKFLCVSDQTEHFPSAFECFPAVFRSLPE